MGSKDGEKKEKKKFRVVDRRFWAKGDDEASSTEGSTSDKPSYVAELEARLAEAEQRLGEMTQQHQESVGDLTEARSRIEREVSREVERTRRALIVDFLDIIDNLDRALEAAATTEDPRALLQGVSMVRDLFASKLDGLGVSRVEALGTRFDPARHEALTVVPVEGAGSDGEVVSVIREGYRIGDDILRPASVAVAQGPLPPGGLSGTGGRRDSQV